MILYGCYWSMEYSMITSSDEVVYSHLFPFSCPAAYRESRLTSINGPRDNRLLASYLGTR